MHIFIYVSKFIYRCKKVKTKINIISERRESISFVLLQFQFSAFSDTPQFSPVGSFDSEFQCTTPRSQRKKR